MDHHPCLQCGDVRGEVLFTGIDRLHRATENSFAVIQCSACGLVYTSPRPSGNSLAVYYPPGAYYAYSAPQPGTSLVWRFRRGALASVLETRHGFPPAVDDRLWQPLRSMSAAILRSRYMGYPAYVPGARILDVGCGDGQFLRQMRDYGFDCWGVEIDGGAVERARTSGLNVQRGSLERLQSMEHAFDVVRFSQVLEHLPEPKVALGNAFRLLKPDGELILLLPNFASLLSRLFREYWFHLDLPRHFSHFTPDSIRRFLHSAGFDRVRVMRYTAEHSITGTLQYWLEEKRGAPAFLRSLLTGSVVRVALIPLVVGAGVARAGDLMEVRAQKPA